MEYIKKLIEKIQGGYLQFEDIFPLNAKDTDLKSLLTVSGIYFGIMIVATLLVVLLGNIFILGVLIKIISIIAGLYALIGFIAFVISFMKYN